MRFLPLLLLTTTLASADPAFWNKASTLLEDGQFDQAAALARDVLKQNPSDADALEIAGMAVLYLSAEPRRDDSIFRPNVDTAAAGDLQLTSEGVEAVAEFWTKAATADASRGYLWGDLAQMAFRVGSSRALEFAAQVLADKGANADSLHSAAAVFALNLDWARAGQALQRVAGERTAQLYLGLDAWRTARDGWRVPLKAFVDGTSTGTSGRTLAAYLLSPAMRDTEAGFQAAADIEKGPATLAVRQKYAERYPDKFQARLGLATALSEFGAFDKALSVYAEIDRRALAVEPEEKQGVLFQTAWAHQAAGHREQAVNTWQQLTDAKEFYIRSAADWFLGQEMKRQGRLPEAKDFWAAVAGEPLRSKYAAWAAIELKKLKT